MGASEVLLPGADQPDKMTTSMARVTAAVSEFLNIWACEGSASLHLDTSSGGCAVKFTAHLGHPGALLQPTPPTPASPSFKPTPEAPPRQRYRGPADKERSRLRTAAFKAAPRHAAATEQSSPIPPAGTAEVLTASTASAVSVIPGKTAIDGDDNSPLDTAIGDGASTSCSAPLPPPTSVNCVNCDSVMTPNHQCEEPISSTSLASSIQVPSATMGACSATTARVNDRHMNTAGPRIIMNMMKFCATCDSMHPYGAKCQCVNAILPT